LKGTCGCAHLVSAYGEACQHSPQYEKIVDCLILLAYFGIVCLGILSLLKNKSVLMRKGNAAATALFEVTVGGIFACLGQISQLYRAFNPTSGNFWAVKGMYFCLVMACIVGLCATSNISLLWIEISTNTGLRILSNINKTKPVLVCVFLSLNILCIILAMIYNYNASYAVVVLTFYLLCALVSFGIGARRVSKLFRSRLAVTTAEVRRNDSQNAEIARMFDNTKSICFFGGLFIFFAVPFIITYNLQNSWLTFILFHGMELSGCGIAYTLIFHLRGERFVSWHCSKLKGFYQQVKISPVFESIRQIQITAAQPLRLVPNTSFKIRGHQPIQKMSLVESLTRVRRSSAAEASMYLNSVDAGADIQETKH